MLGFFFGYLSKIYFSPDTYTFMSFELSSIGNIIPGLIASWMDRQGAVKTISVIMIIAVSTRLIMIIISGGSFYV